MNEKNYHHTITSHPPMNKHLPFICCRLGQWPLLGYCLYQAAMHGRTWSWPAIGMCAMALWWLCYLGIFLSRQL